MSHSPSTNQFTRYKVRDAAEDGRIVTYKFLSCRRTVNFLASDLVKIVGGSWDAHTPPFKCTRCDTWDIFVSFRIPLAGDYGHLVIRRPGAVRKTQTWYTERLGDSR